MKTLKFNTWFDARQTWDALVSMESGLVAGDAPINHDNIRGIEYHLNESTGGYLDCEYCIPGLTKVLNLEDFNTFLRTLPMLSREIHGIFFRLK